MSERTIEGTPVTNGDLVVILSQMQDQLDDLTATTEEQDRKLRGCVGEAGGDTGEAETTCRTLRLRRTRGTGGPSVERWWPKR